MQAEKSPLWAKKSPRAWFERFAKVVKESRNKQSQGDHTLFIKHSTAGGVTVLLVYVDDIIVTGNDEREKHEVKHRLAIEFETIWRDCFRGVVGAFVLSFRGLLGDSFHHKRDCLGWHGLFLEESGKKFGEQHLYAFCRQYGEKEIEDHLRSWSSLLFMCNLLTWTKLFIGQKRAHQSTHGFLWWASFWCFSILILFTYQKKMFPFALG